MNAARRLVQLTTMDGGSGFGIVTFGVHESATYCPDGMLDPDLNEVTLPPTPPPGVFDVRFQEHRTNSTCLELGLNVHVQEPFKLDTFRLNIIPSDAGYPLTLQWPESLSTGGWSPLILRDTGYNPLFYTDMLTETSLVVANEAVRTFYIIGRNWLDTPPGGTVTVTSPNGGQYWVPGSTHDITWGSVGVANVAIEYSTNLGTTWNFIATQPSTGTYPWLIPNTPSNQCLVRISAVSDSTINDVGDGAFTIPVPPPPAIRRLVSLTVANSSGESRTDTFGVHENATYCVDGQLDPDLREQLMPPLPPSEVFDIRFVEHQWGSVCLGTGLRLHLQEPYKLDTFKLNLQTGDNGFPVEITWPAGLAAEGWDSLVIQDAVTGTFYSADMLTDSSLSILNFLGSWLYIIGSNRLDMPPPPSISVDAPNGGETWYAGSNRDISWTSASVGGVVIDYTTDQGLNWIWIASQPSTGSYDWLVPNTPSTQCQVRIRSAEDAGVGDISDAVFTISNNPTDSPWRLIPLTVSDAGTGIAIDTFGVHENGTYCPDGVLNWNLQEQTLPPPPPPTVFDVRFVEHRTLSACMELGLRIHLQEPVKLDTFRIQFQPGDGGYPFTFRWPSGLASQGWETLIIRDTEDGSTYYVNMLTDTLIVVTDTSVTTLDIVGRNSIEEAHARSASVLSRWNLVSVPLVVGDYLTSALFPTATTHAFSYQGVYVQRDTLYNAGGFWAKFDSDQEILFQGELLLTDTVIVSPGWNLIGSISDPVAVSAIISVPGGMSTSRFYSYVTSYLETDTIEPGRGYWVKVDMAGSLILGASGPIAAGNRINIQEAREDPPPPPCDEVLAMAGTPEEVHLRQNYPNPFNPSTTIQFALPMSTDVRLMVYNLVGEIVDVLIDGNQPAGYKTIEWDASALPSGVYYLRLNAGGTVETKKLVLLR
ncbi:MAG TPA: T9SS type A sorting domain-containing protein [Bacteroidota bacterium]|nr:T9SS type A sorting domain-containing protein [Bacteroidota bacterium]